MDTKEILKSIISNLPDTPGVYQYYDKEGIILYVGKAKSLKKRVSSYFNKDKFESGKTAVLVRKIVDIRTIIVETELDALLLENNLIKKLQPRYNVMLKDDKTYPWICVKKERFPRVFQTRKFIRDGSEYFGPYANVKMIHTLLDLIHSLYQLRNCNLNLSEDNIAKNKFKVCLEYHIGNCKGPCEGHQNETDYNETITQIRDILKGNINSVISYLKEMMMKASTDFDYETAHLLKEKIELLERFKSKSIVVNPNIHNVDVFSFLKDNDNAFVNFMKIVNGAIIQSHTIELKPKIEESDDELLSTAIAEMRLRFNSDSPEIITTFLPDVEMPGITITIPKIGDKKHLLTLSEKNLKYYMKERRDAAERVDPHKRVDRLMLQMKKDLRLQDEPRHIECFDNSNFQGDQAVAAMSVYKDGRPSKKDYRHFNIRSVVGPDDFASMEEVIYRRYKRMLDEKTDLPQLIIVDGGKGQLSSALKSLEALDLRGKIGIIGIAKKLEEIYFPGDSIPLYLDKKGETLKIIQQLRDEVHRFGITHHRKKREKATIKTELTEIKGISEVTSTKLLKEFKSVKNIKLASSEDIEKIIGKAKAKLVLEHFSKSE